MGMPLALSSPLSLRAGSSRRRSSSLVLRRHRVAAPEKAQVMTVGPGCWPPAACATAVSSQDMPSMPPSWASQVCLTSSWQPLGRAPSRWVEEEVEAPRQLLAASRSACAAWEAARRGRAWALRQAEKSSSSAAASSPSAAAARLGGPRSSTLTLPSAPPARKLGRSPSTCDRAFTQNMGPPAPTRRVAVAGPYSTALLPGTRRPAPPHTLRT